MTDESKAEFFEYAKTKMPLEACALLIVASGKEIVFPCRNLSDRAGEFTLDAHDYRKAADRGDVIAVIHSHVYCPPIPSDADLASCEASNLPWFICSVPNGTWHEFKPTGFKAPLVGRQWAHGVHDCYNLVCDYYKEKLGADLPYFHREYNWYAKGFDLYCRDNWELSGFREIPLQEIREHDALLMQIHAKVINHAGIYLGKNIFLHQMSHRLSTRDIYGGYFQRHTVRALRYLGVK